MDFEKRLKRLEEIVGKMESSDLALDESLKLFEEGVKLSRECNTHLAEAEQKVKVLMGIDSGGNPVTRDFAGLDGAAGKGDDE